MCETPATLVTLQLSEDREEVFFVFDVGFLGGRGGGGLVPLFFASFALFCLSKHFIHMCF